MKTKITGYAFVQTPEGLSVAYTYSRIDEHGNVVASNVRGSYIDDSTETADFLKELDETILTHIEE